MLKRIEEYGKWVEITGFRNIHVGDAKELSKAIHRKLTRDCEVQLFDADLVATWQHLYYAAVNALMSLKSGRGVSKSVALETVLYASAQRQIKKAIDLIGMKHSSKNAAVILICEKDVSAKEALEVTAELLGAKPDESVLDLSQSKNRIIRKAFDVSDSELAVVTAKGNREQALVDLVLERVALLSTRL